MLASDQQEVARFFASSGRKPERDGFSTVSSTVQQTGAPIIAGCLSWFDCTLEDILPGGDHEILVGRVAAAGGRTGEPLVYWAGDYRALTAETRQPSLGQVQSAHYRDRGSPTSARAAVEGHRHLLAVLRRADPEAAREEMGKHLAAVRQQLEIG